MSGTLVDGPPVGWVDEAGLGMNWLNGWQSVIATVPNLTQSLNSSSKWDFDRQFKLHFMIVKSEGISQC